LGTAEDFAERRLVLGEQPNFHREVWFHSEYHDFYICCTQDLFVRKGRCMADAQYMVAVIGAGPAGLYASRKLAEAGVRVVLLNFSIL